MKGKFDERPELQWHPAFFAGIRIEFLREGKKMFFENEHQLGTKPKEIDVLIIKKNSDEPIQKNIGRIFRKHNLVEYKSPTDYLGIDDFYKTYAYAYFYKTDTAYADEIDVQDITISFVCKSYPKKLIAHLLEVRKFEIKEYEEGIFYIMGDIIPIQLIVTSQLSKQNNFWLRSLTNDLKEREEAEEIVREYQKHEGNQLYHSVMDIIVHANAEKFEEVKNMSMCQALRDLFKDELEEGMKLATEQGLKNGMQQGMQQGIQQGVKSMIEACKSLGGSWDKVKEMVMEKFSVQEEQAVEYMRLYW